MTLLNALPQIYHVPVRLLVGIESSVVFVEPSLDAYADDASHHQLFSFSRNVFLDEGRDASTSWCSSRTTSVVRSWLLKVMRPDLVYRNKYLRNLIVMFLAVLSSLLSLHVSEGERGDSRWSSLFFLKQ